MHLVRANSPPVSYLIRLGIFSLHRTLRKMASFPASIWKEVVIASAGDPPSKLAGVRGLPVRGSYDNLSQL